ncbi:MAG: glutamine--fructose-6-phosphate transaminase (isomerizing) [Dehalococcoidia bacterium]|nr:glutamine--fructose-6-phosphate transaminase (isomerizing) [Dehalococcoidia bacterium]
MCGIFGCVGEQDVSGKIINGLKRLEYRGYDSAGICLNNTNNSFEIIKSYNSNYPVDVLKKSLNDSKIYSESGIGHTRWATHGMVNNINTHPHLSFSKKTSIVHNGIVENYDYLKNFLLRNDIQVLSQTDSEIIAHLIELKLCCKNEIEEAIFSTIKMIEGINSVALMNNLEPDKIYAFSTDESGGLVLGENDSYKFISSDSYALENECEKVIYTEKNELVIVSRENFKILNKSNLSRQPKEIYLKENKEDKENNFLNQTELQTHFIMEKEISEQNQVLKKIIDKRIFSNSKDSFPEINKHKLLNTSKFIFTGMGSSYNAAQYGSLLFENLLNIDSRSEFSSELKNKKIIDPEHTTLFAITQSGETADTVEAINNCKNQGVNVISILEEPNSKAAKNSDSYLKLETGKEISVAATKTFSSTLLMCISICIYTASLLNINTNLIVELIKSFENIENNIKKVLNCCDYDYPEVSKLVSTTKNVFLIGKNLTYPISREGSLKLQEISKINSNSFIEGELKHGPNALLGEESVVISIIGPSNNINKSINSLREIHSRNATIITISYCENEEISSLSKYNFVIENNNPYIFPLLAVLPLQKISFMSALNLGLDPDRPQNLAKTVTVE